MKEKKPVKVKSEKTVADIIKQEREKPLSVLNDIPAEAKASELGRSIIETAIGAANSGALKNAKAAQKIADKICKVYNLDPVNSNTDLCRLKHLQYLLSICMFTIRAELIKRSTGKKYIQKEANKILNACREELLADDETLAQAAPVKESFVGAMESASDTASDSLAEDLFFTATEPLSAGDGAAYAEKQAILYAILDRVMDQIVPKSRGHLKTHCFSAMSAKLVRELPGMTADGTPKVIEEVVGKNKISTVIALNMDSTDINQLLANKIEGYDLCVYYAISTLWTAAIEQEKKPVFTPTQIARLLSGKKGDGTVSQKQKREVIESVDKMRKISILVDYTGELEAFPDSTLKDLAKSYSYGDMAICDKVLLNLSKISILNNNAIKDEAWIIEVKPILLEYCEKKGRFGPQIVNIPAEYLAAGTRSSTREKQIISTEINTRIQLLKNKRNSMNIPKIAYKKIYGLISTETDNPNTLKTKQRAARLTTLDILSGLKEMGAIADYKIYKSGGVDAGVEIILPEEEEPKVNPRTKKAGGTTPKI